MSTVTAARILKGQLQNKTGEEESLRFEEFPYLGLSKVCLKILYLLLQIYRLVGCFGFNYGLFETIFQSIPRRLPKRERKKREKIDERNSQNTPLPHPLQAQLALVLVLSK